jgi:hypothetical protein
MPMPSGANDLTLGGTLADLRALGDEDCSPALRDILENWMATWVGQGCPSPKKDGQTKYQALYGTVDTGVWTIWAGKPSDPPNPDEVDNIAGSSANSFGIVAVAGQSNVEADQANDTLTLIAGTNMTITTNAAGDEVTFASAGGGGASNSFVTIAIAGQTDVVADSTTDTLTLVAGTGITLTTNAGTDTITVTNSGASVAFGTIAVSGQSNVVADAANDTLTLNAGSNVTITTNAGADEITIAATDTNTTYSAGTYLDLAGTTFNVDLTEIADYDGTKNQFPWHRTGTIEWESITGYDATKIQLLGHDTGVWHLKTVAEWLALLPGYTLANAQSIGKDAADTPEWQDDDTCP